MIKLICAFNDKEITIDHREIVNIREFKIITSGIFCMLTLCRDDGTLIGFIPVLGSWVDIKSKIEKDIGREMTIEEWGKYCPDSIVHVTLHTDESKTKNGDEMFHVEQ